MRRKKICTECKENDDWHLENCSEVLYHPLR